MTYTKAYVYESLHFLGFKFYVDIWNHLEWVMRSPQRVKMNLVSQSQHETRLILVRCRSLIKKEKCNCNNNINSMLYKNHTSENFWEQKMGCRLAAWCMQIGLRTCKNPTISSLCRYREQTIQDPLQLHSPYLECYYLTEGTT